MKVIWLYLSEADRKYLLSQIPPRFLRKEILRRKQQPLKEAKEENDEEKFEFTSEAEKKWAFRRLASRYNLEEAQFAVVGVGYIPKWLQKEILERRKEVWDESTIKVYCTKCDWKGTRDECGYGHDDVVCPTCGKETIEEVMQFEKVEG